MTVRDDLIAARALIDTPEKWIKGQLEADGCFCSLGAIVEAVSDSADMRVRAARHAAAQAALERSMSRGWKGYRLWMFNDADTTRHRHVLSLFDRAIANAEQKP